MFHISQKDSIFQISHFRLLQSWCPFSIERSWKIWPLLKAAEEPKVQVHCLACCACHICSLIYQEEPGTEKQVALSATSFLAVIIGLPARCQNCCDSRWQVELSHCRQIALHTSSLHASQQALGQRSPTQLTASRNLKQVNCAGIIFFGLFRGMLLQHLCVRDLWAMCWPDLRSLSHFFFVY